MRPKAEVNCQTVDVDQEVDPTSSKNTYVAF